MVEHKPTLATGEPAAEGEAAKVEE